MKSQVDVKNNAQVFLAESHLLDGRVVIVRAIRPSDKSLLIDEAEHMSKRSMYYRYFIPKKQLTTKELVYFTEVDYHRHVCLIALVQEPDGLLAAADILCLKKTTK